MINQEVLLNAGFKPPPPVVHTKPDPRGPEYGTFEVRIHTAEPKGYYNLPASMHPEIIEVKCRDRNGHAVYTMYFPTPESFAAWAKEAT